MNDKPMYVNLHSHTDYSLLDGLAKVNKVVDRAVEYGMPALAITDHGVLHGAVDHYKKCISSNIKPILGVEAYMAPRTRFDKVSKIDSKYFHLTLLARNNQGYSNLIELVTASWMEGFYYKPRIDKDLLAKKSEGLIILTGCVGGEVAQLILQNKVEEAEKLIGWYQEIVGKDHVFVEIQDHPLLPDQVTATRALKEIAKKHNWPLVVTGDSHYVKHEDKDAHEILLAVQSKSADEDKRWSLREVDLHLRTPEDYLTAFSDVPEALENTLRVADLCDVSMTFGENKLPEFPSTKGIPNKEELRQICEEGLTRRYGEKITQEHRDRMEYELSVIEKMGFSSYFLIVSDYVNYAKNNNILVGPGRGSAAGSMVAYLTGITELDPIHYGLLFERFLNPDRVSMPDIDTDFADIDRPKILQYVRQKYGDDHVAGIITFGTMAARAAVRDTGRALGMSYGDVDRIAKLVPPPKQGKHVPIKKLIEETPELKQAYDTEAQTKKLLDLASQLEGTFRHAGQHASAFVISKDPLTKTVPLQPAQKGDVAHVTQFSMGPVDELGLLKMDFLGLSNLSTIQRAVEIIEAVYGDKIDVANLPLDDKKAFELLSRGETTGVFQLESGGMKRYLKELKPSIIDDIIAMVALYRPGPMQWIEEFIDRKHGRKQIEYVHPKMKDSLESTYGVLVYQEQVMQISKDLCGFTGGQADTLRKAIGKKKADVMAKMKEDFIEGAVKVSGADRQKITEFWASLEDFAAYCFNKSHAACYGYIAYQTAYLKSHYPAAFMAALMTNDHGDTERLTIDIEECRRMGMEVLPPDVNESFVDFGVVKETGNIRFGLSGIKNIGEGVTHAIVKERKANGPFKSLVDFVERLGGDVINKKAIENLAKSGAFDRFAPRAQVLAGMEQILKFSASQKKAANSNQIGLFDVGGPVTAVEASFELPEVEEVDQRQRLIWEKELLGMYLSDHPLKEVEDLIKTIATPIKDLTLSDVNKRVRVAGVVVTVKKILTKSKSNMAFGNIEDTGASMEFVLFPRTLEQYEQTAAVDNIILIEGTVNARDAELKISVDKVWPIGTNFDADSLPPLDQAPPQRRRSWGGGGGSGNGFGGGFSASQPAPKSSPAFTGTFGLLLDLTACSSKETLGQIKTILDKYPGETEVKLRLKNNGETKEISTKSKVDLSQPIEVELSRLIGKAQVTMVEIPK